MNLHRRVRRQPLARATSDADDLPQGIVAERTGADEARKRCGAVGGATAFTEWCAGTVGSTRWAPAYKVVPDFTVSGELERARRTNAFDDFRPNDFRIQIPARFTSSITLKPDMEKHDGK